MILIPRHAPDIPEITLQKLVHARLNLLPGVRVWRASSGAARRGAQLMHFGTPGQADLSGLMLLPSGVGQRLEVELKTRRGRQTDDQRLWQLEIERYGGVYILARTLDEALVPVCRALGLDYELSGATL